MEKIKLTKKQLFDLQFKYSDIVEMEIHLPEPDNIVCSYTKREYWEYISNHEDLSEDFIREFKDYLNWEDISYYQTLSEDFIREFKDYVDWENISSYQILSEDFIREFKDRVNWLNIFYNRTLSDSFIREMKKEGYINE